jgi:hypothetical protein
MEMILVSILLTTAFCSVKMEMLLAETKYPSLSVIFFEKPSNEIPLKLIDEEDLALSYFLQKNDDKTNLLVDTDYSTTEHNNIVDFITLIRIRSYG